MTATARSIVYRYSPRYVRERFDYPHSEALLARLTPDQRKIIQPTSVRRPPPKPEGYPEA